MGLATFQTTPAPIEAAQPRERIALPAFLVLIFAVCWTGMLPMILASRGVRIPGPLKLLQVLMLFGPALVAFLAAWWNGGRPAVAALLRGIVRWRCRPALYLAVLASPVAVFALALALSNALGLTATPLPPPAAALPAFGTSFGVYLLLNAEEIAWRGYVLPRLQSSLGATRATLVLAVVWILFHLPLFWMRGGHPAGYPFWLFALMLLGISLPFTAVFNATRGSILMAHLLHQSFNAAVDAIPIYPRTTHSLAPVAIAVAAFFAASALLLAARKVDPPADRST